MSAADVITAHETAGRYFTADGVRSFVLDSGSGDPVVMLHGVPASCFLYRKLVRELAQRSLRGVAFDLPGLGLADRPPSFDYSWSGLGRFSIAAVDALDLSRFHLVVHDIGGPVGFELARAMPERIASLTVLNTLVDVDEFSAPWPMLPFRFAGVGWLWLNSMTPAIFRQLWYLKGIADRSAMTHDEIEAHFRLLKRGDGGAAFLKMMRAYELTREKREHYHAALNGVPYPVQIVWGADDTALTLRDHGERVQRAAGVELQTLPGKHFFQEEQAPAIADRIAALAQKTTGIASGREKSVPSPS